MTHTAASLPTDDALVDELRRLTAVADPVPHAWREAAVAGYDWHRIEAEPAALAYDSLSGHDPRLGPLQLAGRILRELRWTGAGRAVAVEVDVGDDRVRVVGKVWPGASVEVLAVWPEGLDTVTSRDRGRFLFDDLPRRPLCLVVGGEVPIKTGWIMP
jgi:hypothetical protein